MQLTYKTSRYLSGAESFSSPLLSRSTGVAMSPRKISDQESSAYTVHGLSDQSGISDAVVAKGRKELEDLLLDMVTMDSSEKPSN